VPLLQAALQQAVAHSPALTTLSPATTHATHELLPLTSQNFPLAQSPSAAQVVLQAVPLVAQPKLFGHAPAVPAVQLPVPLHVPGVSVEPGFGHEAQLVVGPLHAPVLVQLVAPQTPVVVQADVQQSVRQALLAHEAFPEQPWPAMSRQAPDTHV
jgi:hypothetical protein